jgi:ADP-heptose:LPS heptosyltransferase
MRSRPVIAAGHTSLGGLAALIGEMDLFISNDTGPGHLAQAVGTRSVVIFGPTEYHRWAPLEQARHRSLRMAVECSPCDYGTCPIDHRCMRGVTPDTVMAAAGDLLRIGVAA